MPPGVIRSSSTVAIGSGGGGGPLYPNKPPSYTNTTEINFSQAIPSTPPFDQDTPITGTDWFGIWQADASPTMWQQTTDATAPQSPPGIWRAHWAPGSYGGGVIGEGAGHGIGSLFTRAMSGTNRIYFSLRCYFEFPNASYWHPISNKFVNIECNNSLLLNQLFEGNGAVWRHAEELAFTGSSWWADNNTTPGENHIGGIVDNRAVPINQWTQLEGLIDIPGGTYKMWQDGVLTTNVPSPPFVSSNMQTFGIFAFRGGGGETLNADLFYRYDHFHLAWP
jgi:hypothetical protein